MNTVEELTTVVTTGDIRIDALLDNVSPWNFLLPARNTLYYTFDTSDGSYIDNNTGTELEPFNASQQAAARNILTHAAGLTGINFVEVATSDGADIHFGSTDLAGEFNAGLAGTSFGYSQSNGEILSLSADVTIWLDNVEFAASHNELTPGSQGYQTLLHEIGHMLGLGHPFNDPNPLPAELDNDGNTVMSYTSSGTPSSQFQAFDLWALTWIYGGDGLAGERGYNSQFGHSLEPGSEDVTAPTITGFLPADGSENVPVDGLFEITFSEVVNLGSGEIRLVFEEGTTAEIFDVGSSPALVMADNLLTITPTQALQPGRAYRFEFSDGSLVDLAGNHLAASATYDFATVPATDHQPPAILALSPADDAANVDINTSIQIDFSELVVAGNGRIILQDSNGQTVDDFSGDDLRINGHRVTVIPVEPLTAGEDYSLRIEHDALRDTSGNSNVAVTGYSFSTRAADAATDDFAGNTATLGTLAIEESTFGELEVPGDEDWFRIALTTNGAYQFSLLQADPFPAPMTDPVVEIALLDSNGEMLTYLPASGLSLPAFSPRASGDYFLAVKSLGENGVGSYELTASFKENNPPGGQIKLFGAAEPGGLLVAETRGLSDADGLGAFSYQWLRGDTPMAGATGASYVIGDEDLDQPIAVQIVYTDGEGVLESLTSAARLPTAPLNDAFSQLIEMYLVILGRAPDEQGLQYWSGRIDEGRTFEDVANAMWRSPGAQAAYPDTLSMEEKVATVYRNVLVREPDDAGLNFWLQRWQDPDIGPVDTMLRMIEALNANNSSDPDAISDKILFDAKVDLGGYLAISRGNNDLDLAADSYTYLEAGHTLTQAQAFVDARLDPIGTADSETLEVNLI